MSGLFRRRRGSVAWLMAIGLLAAALAILAFVPTWRPPDDGGAGSLVGQQAPELRGPTLDGGTWDLRDAEASLTWVNFWATSCEPCRTEMPAMQRLAETYAGRLTVVGVDWGESRETVADFVKRYGVSYPVMLDPGLDNYYRWAVADGLPRHYFVDGDGVVVREVIGPLAPAEMVAILDELLGEPA